MRTDREYLDALARLDRIPLDERRAAWRQSLATLAAEASDHRPVPLEGLDPEGVLRSVQVARASGFLDDLDFLSGPASASALYQLAAVLPSGEERRELGRRVARRLHTGDASTFVALATQLAIGSRRGLSGPAVRARVALALELPIGTGTRADALALALTSRRDLAEEWLVGPSTGSLPSRRLAARLLERAAREAARRCSLGDSSVLVVFDRPTIRDAWNRLLADRESLVWRHVAAARGLLCEHAVEFDDQIRGELDPKLSPTEWRRATASLAASVAVNPEGALKRAAAVLEGELLSKDRGIPAAMLLGLPRAAEAEPEAADQLCTMLMRAGGLDAAEALLSLTHERVGGEFGAWACQMARAKLREDGWASSDDDGAAALAAALDQDLRPADERDAPPTLRMHLEAALDAFAESDARSAYAKAFDVLRAVEETLGRLEASSPDTSEGRKAAFSALREIDGVLLETSALADLLQLGARQTEGDSGVALDTLFDRLTRWLLQNESQPVPPGGEVPHRMLRINRLRTLLHTVDADAAWSPSRSDELRARRLKTAHTLLRRVREDAPSPLRRVVTAAAARACDALLREEIGEMSDVFLAVIEHVETAVGLDTMADASMVPEMETVFRAYASLVERTQRGVRHTRPRLRASLEALRGLIRAFPTATSPRVDALHNALHNFGTAVELLMGARSLAEMMGEGDDIGSRVAALERSVRLLWRLKTGALRRLGDAPFESTGVAGPALRVVDIALERAARADKTLLREAVQSSVEGLHEDLPTHLAEVAGSGIVRAISLPAEAPPGATRDSFLPVAPRRAPLPPWLPPSRTLGGFYVLRALGSGAVGSVFVAQRSEERNKEEGERFALKVPEYSGAAARTLSEDEFLRLFREEAGALLAIPEHENLARLVTFDAGARPKPILVMELVEGPTMERLLETGALHLRQVFDVLDGIARGLAAMHEAGVGHLDVKPSNVILRDADASSGRRSRPVLVDFGLAGRNVRPGCATAHYGAPEVWGLNPAGGTLSPAATDVYAFGCVAFELLTNRELIHGPNEVAIITAHVSHDGDMDGLRWLAQDSALQPLARVLGGALRQDPRDRSSIVGLREQLAEVRSAVETRPWPLEAS